MAHGHAHHVHEQRSHEVKRRGQSGNNNGNHANKPAKVTKKNTAPAPNNAAGAKAAPAPAPAKNTANNKPIMGVGPAVAATQTTKNTQPTNATAANTANHQPATTKNNPQPTQQTTQHTTQDTTQQTTQQTAQQTTHNTATAPTQTQAQATQKQPPTQTTKTKPTATDGNAQTATKIKPTDAGPTAAQITAVSHNGDTHQDHPPRPQPHHVNGNGFVATHNPSVATAGASTSSSTVSSSQSQGLPLGAIVGIAVGGAVGLALIGVLIFFLVRKKKKAREEEEENEKKAFAAPPPAPTAKPGSPAAAPQLNVRPITQFNPDLASKGGNGANAGYNPAAGPGARNLTANSSSPPRSAGSNPFNDPVNPFSNANTPMFENGPSGAAMASPGSARSPGSADGESVASATWAADGAAGMAAVAGAASGASPNNVYRVQMDFNPSMEDELALRSGSLVRMLHEYDDGWVSSSQMSSPEQSRTNNFSSRLSAFALTVPSKVWLLDLACLHAL